MADKPKPDRAEAELRKKAQAEDGKLATREYLADLAATREKTARLRALRLAKEAADAEAVETPGARVPTRRAAAGRKAATRKRA